MLTRLYSDNSLQGGLKYSEARDSNEENSYLHAQEHTSQLESDKEHTVDSVFEIEHACIEDLPADFVPNIDELRIALEFIRAVQFASLDNGDLPPAVVMWLKDPLQEVLQIHDLDELYSLKQYLAIQGASQQTYITVHNNHNEQFPESPMLSYVDKKVAEWSSMQPIVHNMCPNSCMAYTGPFAQLDNCTKCELSHWDPFQFENSQGKVKVAAQHFYTIPLTPQLQSLWRSP